MIGSATSTALRAEPPNPAPGDPLTYTLRRDFNLVGAGNRYDELLLDYIPGGATYLEGSATLNGLATPQLYSATLDAIYYQPSGTFSDTDSLTITFQVQVGGLLSGTLILNRVTETVRSALGTAPRPRSSPRLCK